MKTKKIVTVAIDIIQCDWCKQEIVKKSEQCLVTLTDQNSNDAVYDLCPACLSSLREKFRKGPEETTKKSTKIIDRLGESDVSYYKKLVAEEMKNKNLSQNKVAKAIGIPQPTLNQIMTGKRSDICEKTKIALEDYFK